MVLYLSHLAATGRSMASIKQARAVVSHFQAAAGMRKADNPARHPVVAEAVNEVREFYPSSEGVVCSGRNQRKLLTSPPPWT